jgi:cytochrome b561
VLDNPFWWHAHRLLNGLALATSGLAVVLVLLAPATPAPSTTADARAWHALLGWSLLACGLVQLLGGWLRGSKGGPTAPRLDAQGQPIDWHGDHYDMSPRRYAFERLHKSLGYLALLLSVLTLGLGLWHADAPRWMALALGLWWLLLGSAFVRLQSLGRCIDTYQAIWGPGPEHPGNHKPVVGWGIQRVVSTQGQE